MYSSIIAIATLALASSVSAGWNGRGNGWRTDTGTSCCWQGLRHCQQDQGDWGCVQINGGGPNCVRQTRECDDACGGSGYAYQRTRSNDDTCICTYDDASQQADRC
ncbi:hypothetical protein DOTSEDRAFT_28805 [Dothistroma septosporum NZE10]|uniref:Uncharacterized protein n=1 Tax=Dothistroma septosporum (strain NZE10 / CBS 128990) TaxID=675120 RepID=M2WL36_DOTSN|nr:hypothetical protein DOTSEDRAFT_28805 [Dothistroma septosporum NZE10]